jgi:hypothetical protein
MIISTPRPYASAPALSKTQAKYIRSRLKRFGFANYGKYATSRRWRKKKAQYWDSDLPQVCVVCGDPNVDLHHRTYKRVCEEKLTDLFPLCREHHEAAHRLDRQLAAQGVVHQGLWSIARSLRKEFEAEAESNGAVRLALCVR